jgi:hypothetical protein
MELVSAPGVVDEQVEPAVLAADAVEESLDLGVVGVIAADGDSDATPPLDLLGGVLDRARLPSVVGSPRTLRPVT